MLRVSPVPEELFIKFNIKTGRPASRPFLCVPSMELSWAEEVRYGGTYQPTIREAQAIYREVLSEESVEQNLGSMYKNLISRLYNRIRLHNKSKSKRYA